VHRLPQKPQTLDDKTGAKNVWNLAKSH